ncbi:copper chaperone CopZ [Virgibacillus sp. YIM 98842]|jgi:copper chaperone|uniref:copper chaperone CopZ n=1 Tax=Virgibacillus sp. YIM 98842 TaxID=2663533 RepID=UPI0013DBF711|nr:copper chaperone CopZ [Virgibacillus sp. YIM 98842]
MKEATLGVKGMTCNHCVASVEGALKSLDGVSNVDVNLDAGKVDVKFDGAKVSKGQLAEAVEDQGYDVE